ncbi:MAG: hypothetical protein CL840_12250 [Crocinitomicaceae bacterium]|nr:hypothetical protein [Crocinitomicaceae bacterium]|tara:strand:+ start:2455 stop:3153 length:699 start_codon:yes stop_codon:yes gene_type:complete
MKKIILSTAILFYSLFSFSQLEGDKVFIRANIGVGLGFNSILVDAAGQNNWNNSLATFTISPGTHLSPELAVGVNVYDNLNAEVGFAYLLQFVYSNVNGYVTSASFSRMSTCVAAKYAIELKEDKFALTPGIGVLVLPASKMKFQEGDFSQEINYGSGVGFMASFEAQIRLGKKVMINPGIRYRVESYTAKSTSFETVSDLNPGLQLVRANGIQIIFGVIVPIVRHNRFGRY